MAYVEARSAELGHGGFHHHIVAEARRNEKPRADIDQGEAGEFLSLGQLVLRYSKRLLEQDAGGVVEDCEIAREEHDAHRIAVAPLNPDLARMDQHESVPVVR